VLFWFHGGKVISFGVCVDLDAENFYVLEDWVIDKARGNGVTGWVGGWHGYQRQLINGLENLVKYYLPSSPGVQG
jgi:hypothetical protein